MKYSKKVFLITFLLLSTLALVFYLILSLINSRNFQFFGELVDHIQTDQKVIALTFDDSPSPQSDQVLAILSEQGIKATFFSIGQNIEKNPQQFQNILNAGMEVGNHSYSHQRNVFKPYEFYQQEIDQTNQLIRQAGYSQSIHFRPPYGKKLFGLPWYLAEQKIKTIMWDIELPENNLNTDQIVNYIVSNTKPGSIIIMHPFCELECINERNALPQIITELKLQGYQFLTITELISLQNM